MYEQMVYKVKLSSTLKDVHGKKMTIRRNMRVGDVKQCIMERAFDTDDSGITMTTTIPCDRGQRRGSLGSESDEGEDRIVPEITCLRLIYKGKIMKDTDMIDNYQVKDDDKLYVVEMKDESMTQERRSSSSQSSFSSPKYMIPSPNTSVPPEMKFLGDMMKIPEVKVNPPKKITLS
jgi:hypothetical protein